MHNPIVAAQFACVVVHDLVCKLNQMRHDLELALQDRASMQEAISQLPSLVQSEAQCQQEIADLRDDNAAVLGQGRVARAAVHEEGELRVRLV